MLAGGDGDKGVAECPFDFYKNWVNDAEATQAAVRGEFAKLAESDQERLLLVARDIMRDIKPVAWMS